jgi:hypothetical protein
LLIEAKSRKIVILEHPVTPIPLKEAFLCVLLEFYKVASVSFLLAPVAASFAVGKENVLVIHASSTDAYVLPVYDHKPYFQALSLINMGVRQVVEEFRQSANQEETDSLDSTTALPVSLAHMMYSQVGFIKPTTGSGESSSKLMKICCRGQCRDISDKQRHNDGEVFFQPDDEDESLVTAVLTCLQKVGRRSTDLIIPEQ